MENPINRNSPPAKIDAGSKLIAAGFTVTDSASTNVALVETDDLDGVKAALVDSEYEYEFKMSKGFGSKRIVSVICVDNSIK